MKKDSDKPKEHVMEQLLQSQIGQEATIAFNIISESIVYQDTQNRVIWTNKASLDFVGLPLEKLVGRYCYEIMRQRNTPCDNCPVIKTGKTGKPQESESTLPDGKVVLIKSYPVRDNNGKTIGIVEVSSDISEHKKAEEALRESEEKYRDVVERASDGILIIQDKLIKYANARLVEMWGGAVEEIISTPFVNYVHPDELPKVLDRYEKRMAGKRVPTVYETVLRRKDGSKLYAELNIGIITYQGNAAELVIVRDITERKQAQEALKESENKYRALAESSLTGIFIMQDEKYVYVNNRFAQMHGYNNSEEVVGMHYLSPIHPDDREFVRKIATNRLKGQPAPEHYEVRRLKKAGETFWAEMVVTTIDYKGRLAIMANIVDITEHKQIETEREEMELRNRTTSRLAAVGEMAAGIAHEINNPLTGVIGYAELLRAQEDVPAHIKKDLETIHKGAQRVADIVKRLLAFARQTKPMRDYVNINELIRNTLELRTYQLRTSNIEVTTRLDSNLPVTVADGGQLQQVFLNIIVNAEIEMKLAHGKGKLLIKTDKVDSNIRISFKDDGPGISQENMERIFDPFFTTREVGQGTGLGLSMCHGIITEHGGRIWAESKLGKGATFFVELPIVTEKEKAEESKPVVEETRKANKAKVLVVDDEDVIRDFLSRVLTEEGHQVETADNAEDALEKIKSERYHLILLDIKMPGTSGMELYKRIQKVARSIANRVVFVTGDIMGADTEKFLSETKALYITKPFDAIKLKEELKRLLNR